MSAQEETTEAVKEIAAGAVGVVIDIMLTLALLPIAGFSAILVGVDMAKDAVDRVRNGKGNTK